MLLTIATRTPEGLAAEFSNALDVIPWIKTTEDNFLKGGFDANDWIYQTWAYDRHDVAQRQGSTAITRRRCGASGPRPSF